MTCTYKILISKYGAQTSKIEILCSHPTRKIFIKKKRIISTSFCMHMVVPPDDGPKYARNMYRLTKYVKNKLCIELDFLYAI